MEGEAYDVYYRDILECVRALYGDPEFVPYLVYAPEHHFLEGEEPAHKRRVYHDMYTGDWWWQVQVSVWLLYSTLMSHSLQSELEKVKPGATVIPIIISSDKTTITTFSGKTAYPVYLTIGNLPKEIRRKPSRRGQILLAYLPTTRLDHVTNEAQRKRLVLNITHRCLRQIMRPLKDAGANGVELASGDGAVRRGHTIYAAHVGDYLEHIAVVACKNGECPQCLVPPTELGELETFPLRALEEVLAALSTFDTDPEKFFGHCRKARIKPVVHPFWEDLPFANVFLCVTPDVLHQLLQGLIKYLVKWVKKAYSEEELDKRCQKLPRGCYLRHFLRGISPLSKSTGKEHYDVARILLGLLVDLKLPRGTDSNELITASRALLDFLFLAQYPVHSQDTLTQLEEALRTFHATKGVFVKLGIRTNFNLPKLHFLSHYVNLIRYLGTTDNFNTEYSERLHIEFAKLAYEATNGKDELSQMTIWLERKEKIQEFDAYVIWRVNKCPPIEGALTTQFPPTRVLMTKNPSRKSVTMSELETHYGATFIQDAIARYVAAARYPGASARKIEDASRAVHVAGLRVGVYHKAKFWLGHEEHHPLSSNEWNVAHAHPAQRNKRRETVPGQFDVVLVSDGSQGNKTAPSIESECAGQLKHSFSDIAM